MPDVIIISEGFEITDFSGSQRHGGTYSIFFVRLNSDAAKDSLLDGKSFADLSSSIRDQVEVLPPDGAVLEPWSLGGPAIDNQDYAIETAKKALLNSNGVLAKLNPLPDTPIYFWMREQRADRLDK